MTWETDVLAEIAETNGLTIVGWDHRNCHNTRNPKCGYTGHIEVRGIRQRWRLLLYGPTLEIQRVSNGSANPGAGDAVCVGVDTLDLHEPDSLEKLADYCRRMIQVFENAPLPLPGDTR
jgi:hypothetical protein